MKTLDSEKGIIQLFVMLLLVLFAATGASLMDMERSGTADASGAQYSNQARFMAESGLQEAKWYIEKVDGGFTGASAEQVVTLNGADVGSYQYTVSRAGNIVSVTSVGYYPSKAKMHNVTKTLSDSFTSAYIGEGVVILGSNNPGALTLGGNAKINVNGGRVLVNSGNAQGTILSGHATINAAEIDLVGGYSVSGNAGITGTIKTGYAQIADPLAALPVPDPTTMTVQSSSHLNVSGTVTLQPGVYTGGISVSSNSNVTLAPGVYYIDGGGLSTTGNAVFTANGVIIYNNPHSSTDSISLAGNGNLTLTPPSSGPYKNISVFQTRSATAPATVSGNGTISMNGAFYAASANLTISGNGSGDTIGSMDVVGGLNISGNGTFAININNSGGN
jgi:hypothetical protein